MSGWPFKTTMDRTRHPVFFDFGEELTARGESVSSFLKVQRTTQVNNPDALLHYIDTCRNDSSDRRLP